MQTSRTTLSELGRNESGGEDAPTAEAPPDAPEQDLAAPLSPDATQAELVTDASTTVLLGEAVTEELEDATPDIGTVMLQASTQLVLHTDNEVTGPHAPELANVPTNGDQPDEAANSEPLAANDSDDGGTERGVQQGDDEIKVWLPVEESVAADGGSSSPPEEPPTGGDGGPEEGSADDEPSEDGKEVAKSPQPAEREESFEPTTLSINLPKAAELVAEEKDMEANLPATEQQGQEVSEVGIEASHAAFSDALDQLGAEVPEVQDNIERIRETGQELIDLLEIDRPEVFGEPATALLFSGLADRLAGANSNQDLGEFERQAEKDFATTAGEVLVLEASARYRNSGEPLTSMKELGAAEKAIEIYDRFTNPTLTAELRERMEAEDMLPALRRKMGTTTETEAPFKLCVLDIDDEEARSAFMSSTGASYLAPGWTLPLAEKPAIVAIPALVAQQILRPTDPAIEEIVNTIVRHEYVHTQERLHVNGAVIGGVIEEIRADRISGGTSYPELKDYFDIIVEATGDDSLESLVCTSRGSDDFYPELARRIGLQNTLDIAYTPVPRSSFESSRLQAINDHLGGLQGTIRNVYERIWQSR